MSVNKTRIRPHWFIFTILAMLAGGCQQVNKKPQQKPSASLEAITVQVNDGVIRGNIGNAMDKHDQKQALHALKKHRRKRPHRWTNKSTRIKYHLVVEKTLRFKKRKTLCKDYRITATVDRLKRSMRGRACRDKKGNWYAKHWNR